MAVRQHRVVIDPSALQQAPEEVLHEASSRFKEMAAGLARIPPESVFWASARVSRLCLIVQGWAFMYELDAETLRVTEVRRPRFR
jgi:hypothetical protein